MEFIPLLDAVNEELSCICLGWKPSDEKDHSAVTRKERNIEKELSVVE